MRLELCLAETARIATELLDEAQQLLTSGKSLSRLEQNGVLHALQVLTESAIGKAKQLLKAVNEPVPVSAYEAFDSLARLGDINLVLQLISQRQYKFPADSLLQP